MLQASLIKFISKEVGFYTWFKSIVFLQFFQFSWSLFLIRGPKNWMLLQLLCPMGLSCFSSTLSLCKLQQLCASDLGLNIATSLLFLELPAVFSLSRTLINKHFETTTALFPRHLNVSTGIRPTAFPYFFLL